MSYFNFFGVIIVKSDITNFQKKRFQLSIIIIFIVVQKLALKKWKNDLPDFSFLKNKIEQQFELFFPGFFSNEQNLMDLE